MTPETKASEEFWRLVEIKNPTECWEWIGKRDPRGYGSVNRGVYGSPTASRAAWMLVHGAIPNGLWVLHRCDNPPCVNPEHLFLGTHADNEADKDRKGRRPKGEKKKMAKLTDDAVRELRAARAVGTPPIKALARKFGVDSRTAFMAADRLTWKHVV